MCSLLKVLQIEARNVFVRTLHENSVLSILDAGLSHPSVKVRLGTFDILNVSVNHDARYLPNVRVDSKTN